MITKFPFKILSFYGWLYRSLEHISSMVNAMISGSGVYGRDICIEMGYAVEVRNLDLKFDRPELKSSLCPSLSFIIRELSTLSRVTLSQFPHL